MISILSIHFADCFLTNLDLYLIIVVCMIVVVWKRSYFLYVFLRIDHYHLSSLLIDSLLTEFCMFFFNLNYCSGYRIGFLTKSVYIVWLWNDYYLISSSLIFSLLTLIYIVSFYLNYCSGYFFCCLKWSDYCVWLWNNYYRISC